MAQAVFGGLVEAARREGSAVQRGPRDDLERPAMLAVVMEARREMEQARGELDAAEAQLQEACEFMEEQARLRNRMGRSRAELAADGQTQLTTCTPPRFQASTEERP